MNKLYEVQTLKYAASHPFVVVRILYPNVVAGRYATKKQAIAKANRLNRLHKVAI